MQSGTSRLQRLLARVGMMRSALVLSSVLGLAAVGALVGFSPNAAAAGNLDYRYQRGYYLDNGWLCYGWANGIYHCTAHWHRTAQGTVVSDNVRWVPNYGATTTERSATTHAAPTTTRAAAPVRTAAAPVRVSNPAPVAPVSSGSVQSMIISTFGPYAGAALNVARCESGYNPNAYNASSGASGVFQFLHSTWLTTSYAGYSPFNAWANIQAAHQVFVRDGYSWREWQCQP